MGVRSRIAAPGSAVALMERREPVAKVFGPGTPESFRQGEIASQMTPASPFSPGTPIGPYDGYDRFPRTRDFVTGYNIATRPRTHEKVSFETLKGLIGAYDVARICIRHRIASMRSLDWQLVAADGYGGDVSDAVTLGMHCLKRPDRKTLFKPWLSKYLRDVLSYDAGTLYRMRNRGGRVIGLKVIDGTMVAPLQDYWGDSPEPPAEAYVQYVNGLPWNWLTRDDLIYEPYDPATESLYGIAPIEDVLLNANTDIRFQVYFLQRFTEGNLPAAFAASPENWSPEQIEQWQTYWDAMLKGDQSGKHQIKWMPPGSTFEWSNEKDFSDTFSLFLMQKTCAAFSVVPADLGFTQDVNRSSGESQADVQHRVGDLPLAHHIQDILSAFLQDDLGLPLKFAFDLGEDQDDRLQVAQAFDIWIKNGTVSNSEAREEVFGWSDTKKVPRFIFSERGGPIPLNALEGLSGETDPETAAPVPGAPLPHTAFTVAEGVVTSPPIPGEPLAEQEFGPKALPPAEPVTKEDGAAPSAGITSETGLYGNPLIGADDEDEPVTLPEAPREAAVKSELKAFGNFRKKRRTAGQWSDFEFRHADRILAHNLNDAGRLAVRKAAGEVAVAGLAVRAADTGRVLMLQRALCDDDPAAGTWEMPGGHIEGDETPLRGAWREWAEETGSIPPPGEMTGVWTSPDGVYQGYVWTVDCEASVPVRCGAQISNPDDPDGDNAEAIAWWDPADLPGNSAVRLELLADINAVMAALGCTDNGAPPSEGDESTCPCGTPAVYDEMNGWQHADGSISHDDGESVSDKMGPVAKAADARPKAPEWPGWVLDLRAAGYWAPLLAEALPGALSKTRAEQIARAYLAAFPVSEQDSQGRREQVEAAAAWLGSQGLDFTPAIAAHVQGIICDAHLIGAASAAAVVSGGSPDLAGWAPGDSDTARAVAGVLGAGAVLGTALDLSDGTASQVSDGYLTGLGRALVDGAAAGLGAAAVGASLTAYLSDPQQAHTSVLGLLVTGIGAAALAVYLALKVQRVTWVTDGGNVCPACQANADGSPYRIASVPACPQHPHCRCAVIPD